MLAAAGQKGRLEDEPSSFATAPLYRLASMQPPPRHPHRVRPPSTSCSPQFTQLVLDRDLAKAHGGEVSQSCGGRPKATSQRPLGSTSRKPVFGRGLRKGVGGPATSSLLSSRERGAFQDRRQLLAPANRFALPRVCLSRVGRGALRTRRRRGHWSVSMRLGSPIPGAAAAAWAPDGVCSGKPTS